MNTLFEPVKIGTMEVKNRFVRSATYDGSAKRSGHVSERQLRMFDTLAHGGVGLIVTGITYVDPSGQNLPFQNSMANDEYIPGFKELTDTVHNQGAKIAIQLFHAGRERVRFLKDKTQEALAPSFIKNDPYFSGNYRSMEEDEIWKTIGNFGDAARRSREAGFDAVQVHGAHAFLLSQFLSPYTNHRKDDWGGTLENRLRFHRESYDDIRKKVGDDYPLFIKIGVQDGFEGGLEFGEGKTAARIISKWGFDALEISQGLRGKEFEGTEFRTNIRNKDREAYFREWTKVIKEDVNVPVMMVGGLRTFGLIKEVVDKKETDFISLCRPFIREPAIINDWKSGNYHKATCISCNKCLMALRKGEPLYCVQEKTKGSAEKNT